MNVNFGFSTARNPGLTAPRAPQKRVFGIKRLNPRNPARLLLGLLSSVAAPSLGYSNVTGPSTPVITNVHLSAVFSQLAPIGSSIPNVTDLVTVTVRNSQGPFMFDIILTYTTDGANKAMYASAAQASAPVSNGDGTTTYTFYMPDVNQIPGTSAITNENVLIVASNGSDNIYVADQGNGQIRTLTKTGAVTTPGGQPSQSSTYAVAVDDVYILDTGNSRILKMASDGTYSTLAGGSGGSADGTGAAAQFNNPTALALDSSGNLYVADEGNNTIRKVTPAGVVTTLAGKAGVAGSADGTGATAQFNSPFGVAVDPAGNVYVADLRNETIRQITPAGVVTTLAGSVGASGSADGTGSAARFNNPYALAAGLDGNLYLADNGNSTIRKIAPGGVVTTLAGKAGNAGSADGTGTAAQFSFPAGIAIDGIGDIYVADTANSTMRMISPTGVVTTLAGSPGVTGTTDGTGGAARFNHPHGVAVDGSGSAAIGPFMPALPAIIAQPSTQTATTGSTTTFTVAAIGLPSPLYQWQLNGVALTDGGSVSGSATATLTVTNIQSANAGSYTVAVGNGSGVVVSNAATLTVKPAGAPAITTQPYPQTVNAGSSSTFSVAASGSGSLSYQWLFNGAAISGATSATLTLNSVAATAAGAYSVVIGSGSGSTTSSAATLTVVGGAGAPAITSQPVSQIVSSGSTVIFSVTASGGTQGPSEDPNAGWSTRATTAPTYQWQLNGTPVAGATSARLLISGATAANAGTYTCLVTTAGVSSVSTPATLTLATTSNPGRLVNLSVLASAGKSQVMTIGFVTGGTGTVGSQNLLLRGTGPALSAFGVSGVLADPTLSLFSGSTVIASNDNWGVSTSNQTAVTTADSAVGAFALTNASSLDAALVTSLAAGPYTVQISGNGAASGNALGEVYDDTLPGAYASTTPRLINLSCLTQISAGSSLTAGFVIGGAVAKTVLIRATGPALAAFGVAGTLPDPRLALHTTVNGADTVLATNSGWGGDPQITAVSTAVGAFPLTNPSSADSVLLTTLAPGNYTAIANSVSGVGGSALVEVYEVP